MSAAAWVLRRMKRDLNATGFLVTRDARGLWVLLEHPRRVDRARWLRAQRQIRRSA